MIFPACTRRKENFGKIGNNFLLHGGSGVKAALIVLRQDSFRTIWGPIFDWERRSGPH
jgi:hypothetical protein